MLEVYRMCVQVSTVVNVLFSLFLCFEIIQSEKKAEILKKHTAELNVNKVRPFIQYTDLWCIHHYWYYVMMMPTQSLRLLDPEVERQLGKTILSELESEVSQELEVLVEEFTANTLLEDNHSDVSSALATDKSMVTLTNHTPGDAGQLQQRQESVVNKDQQANSSEQQQQQATRQQVVVTNDFAAELLYMMRSAGDMLGDWSGLPLSIALYIWVLRCVY